MERLISFAEAAARTGTCESTWRKKAARGEISVVRIGRSIRVSEGELERSLRQANSAERGA